MSESTLKIQIDLSAIERATAALEALRSAAVEAEIALEALGLDRVIASCLKNEMRPGGLLR